MAVDDVALDYDNPFPGELFNSPDGNDVYKGCHIDYKGETEVNPHNFMAILNGKADETDGKPVLRSGPESNVFVYFSDHGELGFLVFPDHEPLYAD
jgi:legumain